MQDLGVSGKHNALLNEPNAKDDLDKLLKVSNVNLSQYYLK